MSRCRTYFDDANIRSLTGFLDWNLSNSLNPILNSISHMGNHLNSLSQVIASSLNVSRTSAQVYRIRTIARSTDFFLNDFPVNLSCCDIVLSTQRDIEISLIVSQVQINFTSIIKDEDFT